MKIDNNFATCNARADELVQKGHEFQLYSRMKDGESSENIFCYFPHYLYSDNDYDYAQMGRTRATKSHNPCTSFDIFFFFLIHSLAVFIQPQRKKNIWWKRA